MREIAPRGSTASYDLKDMSASVILRHHTDDTGVFAEIFCEGYYALPEHLNANLRALGHSARFIDLGANIGLFGVWMLTQFPDAHLTAYEPDPFTHARLCEVVARNDAASIWTVIPACASNYNGVTAFAAMGTSVSHMTSGDGDGTTTHVPVMDVFDDLLRCDLIKMDIEGGEWKILLDPRWCDVRAQAVLMEYHPENCPEGDARKLAEDRLRSAGYVVENIMQDPAGHGMLRATRA